MGDPVLAHVPDNVTHMRETAQGGNRSKVPESTVRRILDGPPKTKTRHERTDFGAEHGKLHADTLTLTRACNVHDVVART